MKENPEVITHIQDLKSDSNFYISTLLGYRMIKKEQTKTSTDPEEVLSGLTRT